MPISCAYFPSYSRYRHLAALLHSLFFFFYYYAHHRDLHSFPTRRSSDLMRRTVNCFPSSTSISSFTSFLSSSKVVLGTGVKLRSEEHTSELQSRGHLVCRLLLEKKKKKATHFVCLCAVPE